jgi:hypothetical protein
VRRLEQQQAALDFILVRRGHGADDDSHLPNLQPSASALGAWSPRGTPSLSPRPVGLLSHPAECCAKADSG